jgi:hypothetical protein
MRIMKSGTRSMVSIFGSGLIRSCAELECSVSLPDPEDGDEIDDDDEEEEEETLLASNEAAMFDADVEDGTLPRPASPASHTSRMRISSPPPASLQNASVTTFLLYSNLITSLIGLTTLLLFWIPIPILHFVGWEDFQAPPRETWLLIVGIVLSGVCFNAGFMILLSLWGPVVAVSGFSLRTKTGSLLIPPSSVCR